MINLLIRPKIMLPVEKILLLHAAQTTLEQENIDPASTMSLVFADDIFIKKLNHKFRGIDDTTDVLSFPSNEPDTDTGSLYLGDVIISLPRAENQASLGGHPLADELQLLVVHGTLHLLGYDHAEQVEKEKMQSAQDHILTHLGVSLKITL